MTVLATNRRLAVNHTGWHVEFLSDEGWESAWLNDDIVMPHVFEDRSIAEGQRYVLALQFPAYEFRVYEAVE